MTIPETPSLRALSERLGSDLSVPHLGFEQLSDLDDPHQRGVVCDQILSTADAVGTNLREASEHAERFTALVGPNGRTMPAPDQPGELQEMRDMDRELVGFFRAAGSTVDCLAATAIGVLRLPESIQRADGGAFAQVGGHAARGSGGQAERWSRAARVFEERRSGEAEGWFEWMLEMRNTVVHRARLLNIQLPRPSIPIPESRRLVVPTDQPPARLARYEPHLRRRPWLPDMVALSRSQAAEENWLPEPAHETLAALLVSLGRLVEDMAETLLATWQEVASGERQLPAPSETWSIAPPSARVEMAERFRGFRPDYPIPPLDAIVLNPRDAGRTQIAEALRTT